jgi:opacity protein-like surface antigen
MKKIILTTAAVFALSFASAQKMKFGVRGGVDMVSAKTESVSIDIDGDGDADIEGGGGTASTTGFYVGGFLEFSLADKISLQPGLNYHAASKDGVELNFLSLPVTFRYAVAEKINILAGPSLFYNMDSEAEDKTTFNLDLGGSYDITENFFVDPRYSIGLSGDTKVSHFLLGVGYRF